jgi:DNA-binding transcriptional LysR family regulator
VTGSDAPPAFRLAYVPGVTPGKWVRIWGERLPDTPLDLRQVPAAEAAALLRERGADAGFVRLPVDRTDLSAIPLYTETTVAVVPKDHFVAAADEVRLTDLAGEVVLHPLDDVLGWAGTPGTADVPDTPRLPGRPALERPATTADAVELVAAGIGVLLVPQSLARLHHRRDLTYRPVADAPQSQVALSWREDATTDEVDDLIGIVRGRTANSTRGRRAAQQPEKAPDRKPAKKPATGKAAAGRSAAGKAAGPSGAPRHKGARGGGKPRRRS